ncbi:ribonuclease T2 [Ranunculus cassubicifolius]
MQLQFSVPILLCLLPLCALSCVAQTFDFYYFVQQWPGSYCATKQGCCYPKSGKPVSDFIVYGLQPYSNLGSPLLNCDSKSTLDPSKLSNLTPLLQKQWPSLACPAKDGMKHWSNEWTKHGTCSKSVLDQQKYFQAAINLKKKANLLQILKKAGIEPNGKLFSVSDISEAIRKSVGHEPGIQCNLDKAGNSQLNLIYLCTNTQGSVFIECPGIPMGTCKTAVKFPVF